MLQHAPGQGQGGYPRLESAERLRGVGGAYAQHDPSPGAVLGPVHVRLLDEGRYGLLYLQSVLLADGRCQEFECRRTTAHTLHPILFHKGLLPGVKVRENFRGFRYRHWYCGGW